MCPPADSTAVSAPDVVKLFKTVYGDVHDLQPDDQRLAKDIAWDDAKKVGEKFVEALILSGEVGITLGGSGSEAFEINPAIAGAVKQIEVSPYVSVLPSIVPWAVISRSAGGGEKAFFDGRLRPRRQADHVPTGPVRCWSLGWHERHARR